MSSILREKKQVNQAREQRKQVRDQMQQSRENTASMDKFNFCNVLEELKALKQTIN